MDKQGHFSMFQDLWLCGALQGAEADASSASFRLRGGGGDVDLNSVNNRSINMPLSMPRFKQRTICEKREIQTDIHISSASTWNIMNSLVR